MGRENLFNKYMEKLVEQEKLVGSTIAIFEGDQMVYNHSFGLRKLETNEKMTLNTSLSIQSISKSILGQLFLKLYQNGDINLYDKVVKHHPYFKSEGKEQITLFHLLNHTSGFSHKANIANGLVEHLSEYEPFPEFYDSITQQGKTPITTNKCRDDLTKHLCQEILRNVPGREWVYFTDGYVILVDVLERITGRTWEDMVEKDIFNVYEMNESLINLRGIHKDFQLASLAVTAG